MSNFNVKEVAELIGIAAIVASLIFVGLELQQSQKIAQGAQYQDRVRLSYDYFVEFSKRDVFIRRRVDGLRRQYENGNFDASDLSDFERELLENGSPKEIADWSVSVEVNLLILDNLYFQYQQGLSSDDAWSMQRSRLRRVLAGNSWARHQVTVYADSWRDDFVEEAKRILTEIDAAGN